MELGAWASQSLSTSEGMSQVDWRSGGKPTHLGSPSSRFPKHKIQSFWVSYNSSAYPFPPGQAHGHSSTWISLLPPGAFSPISSITTRQATLQGATHNQGTGVGHCFLGIDLHFCSQGSPGLCEQEQHGEQEEKHVLGRGTERGAALGPRTRTRAGPAPGGQEKPFPHLLSHPLGPRVEGLQKQFRES